MWLRITACTVSPAQPYYLRTLGAEAERARIARDLHDRTAQSLAYIGFELDRLSNRYSDPALPELHRVVREVVVELRETLYRLRTTVTDDEGLVPLAEPYLRRWSDRTGDRKSVV